MSNVENLDLTNVKGFQISNVYFSYFKNLKKSFLTKKLTAGAFCGLGLTLSAV